jgi:hypothetical protein
MAHYFEWPNYYICYFINPNYLAAIFKKVFQTDLYPLLHTNEAVSTFCSTAFYLGKIEREKRAIVQQKLNRKCNQLCPQ